MLQKCNIDYSFTFCYMYPAITAGVISILHRASFRTLHIVLGSLLSLWLLPASAQSLLLDSAPYHDAGRDIAYLKEGDKVLSIDEVLRPEVAGRFIQNTSAVPSFGLTKSAYWFRLHLKNIHPTQSQWLVEIPTAMFWSAPYYIVRSNGAVEQGMIRHQGAAGFTWQEHPTPVFPLALPPQQELTLYFRLQEKGSVRLPLKVWEPKAFAAADHDRQFVGGLMSGVLLAMLAYNLLQFFILRDRNYAWYVGYISTLNLALASYFGFGKEYLWPQAIWWSSISALFCATLTIALAIAFAQSFLQTQSTLPRLHKGLSLIALTELGLGLILLWFGRNTVLNGAILVVSCIGTLGLFFTGLAALRARVREARFFVVAWGALLISMTLICLEYLGVIPVNPMPHQALKISGALEGLLLSLALADRLKMVRRARTMLRNLGVWQEQAREEQRKEIARDLHDKLGQNLLALRMDVGLLHDMSRGTHPQLDESIDRILAQIDSVVKNVRAIMNDLRPAMLDDLGLYAAIEWQVQEFQARTGIVCELVCDSRDLDVQLDEPRATALFRSLQEALNNVFDEQSHAGRIKIDMRRQGGRLIITMVDQDAYAAFDSNKREDMGLAGMHERLAALGGNFSLRSDAMHGIKLTISMPVQAPGMQDVAA
jgi:signal transduction histidine kinase